MQASPLFGDAAKADAGLSSTARFVVGSEILRIAAEIRQLKEKGETVCNLTVGDFDPRYFPIPAELLDWTREALVEGHTNYPPSDGVLPLRQAVTRFYARELGLDYPVESVLIAGGARPLLYGAYKTLVDPGDVVVYSVPSWNNNHYVFLSGAKPAEIAVSQDSNFFPTLEQIRPQLAEARVLIINSPLNPTGTAIDVEELRRISEAVLDENRRRAVSGVRPLYFVYDQVYWTLTFGSTRHHTPVELVPELAPYTLFLDAASKSFCATGLRVGWAVMPPPIRKRMADILGHVGAWAPKAEQIALSRLLDTPEVYRPFRDRVVAELSKRLDALYEGFMAMKRDGYPVDAIVPQGAIYLSARFDLFGQSLGGETIATNEHIRKHLLREAGFAAVPFQAFGLKQETGWFRLSVGAVSMDDIAAMFPRLRAMMGAGVGAAKA
jgi:aspartate aminotransferase